MTVQAVSAQRASDADLVAAIKELQGLATTVVTGGEENAELTLTGIKAEDTIVSGVYVNLESEKVKGIENVTVTIAGDGKVKTATKTAGGVVLVTWFNKK